MSEISEEPQPSGGEANEPQVGEALAMPAVEEAFEEIEVDEPLVGIIMGSKNDKPKMQPAGAALHDAGIRYEVRVMSPSRSRPRSVRVSIRCEMPPTMRLISLKRRGPPPSSMMTNTLHLSPTRARIEATPRQSLSRCALGGRTGPLVRLGTSLRLVTLVCSGFKKVPSCAVCGQPLI